MILIIGFMRRFHKWKIIGWLRPDLFKRVKSYVMVKGRWNRRIKVQKPIIARGKLE
jgi:hypothetical protein